MKKQSFSLFSKNNNANRPSALRVESLEERQFLSVTDLGALAAADVAADSAQYSAQEEVAAIDLSGVADSEAATTELAAPTGLTASAVKPDSLTLSWTPVENAEKYLIYFKTATNVLTSRVTSETSYDLTNLNPDTKFTFYVAAGAEGYIPSDASKLTVTTPSANFEAPKLTAPEITEASAVAGTLTATWSADENAERYLVEYKAEGDAWNEADAVQVESGTSWTFENVDSNAKYQVRVKAIADRYNYNNSDWVYADVADGRVKLSAPEITEAQTANGTLTATWNAVDNAEYYLVDYKVAGEEWRGNSGIRVESGTSWTLENVDSSVSYQIRVKAIADRYNNNNSDWVYADVADARAKLDTPTVDLSALESSGTISWNSVEGAIRYLVLYKTSDAEEWTTVKNITETSLTIENFDADSSYDFKVKAIANSALQINSNFAKASCVAGTINDQDSVATTELAAPTGLTASAVKPDSLTLSWDKVENAEKYLIYFKTATNVLTSRVTTETSYDLVKLNPNTEFTFYVAAGADGYIPSDVARLTVTTPSANRDAAKLARPEISEAQTSNGTLTATWNAVDNAERYIVEYKAEGVAWNEKDAVRVDSGSSWTFENVDSSAVYKVRVKAIGDRYNYNNSDWVYADVADARVKLDMPTVDLSALESSRTISWNSVEGAIRYIVLYKTSDSEEWTTVKNIAETSWTFEDFDANSSYDFKVKAIADSSLQINSSFTKFSYVPETAVNQEELDDDDFELLALSLI